MDDDEQSLDEILNYLEEVQAREYAEAMGIDYDLDEALEEPTDFYARPGTPLFDEIRDACIRELTKQGWTVEMSPNPEYDLMISIIPSKWCFVYIAVTDGYITNAQLEALQSRLDRDTFLVNYVRRKNGIFRFRMRPLNSHKKEDTPF